MQTQETKPTIPAWLVVGDAGAKVTLSTPIEVLQIRTETLHLRTPTVRDLRTCQKAHPGDEIAVDALLFASLAEVNVKDIENLSLKDYERVKYGYFRLVEEDEF
jgi:hypothetical protein